MKKLLLVLFLISVFTMTVFGLSGTYSPNDLFYKPGYGSFGAEEFAEYETYIDIADAQITENQVASGDENIEDTVGAMTTGNTETFISVDYQDVTADIDFVVPVKDEDNMASDSATYLCTQQSIKAYSDTLHALQYLKTEMDSFSEIQAIISNKTLVNEEDVFTIDANWVNIANPWADNEVVDDITITAADSTDATCFPAIWETVTGAQKLKSDAGLTYNAETGDLKATLHGGITEANLLDKSATETITGNWTSTGTLDLAYTSTGVAGETGFESHIIQTTAGLTGTLRGAYITASNAQEAECTGTIRGLEVKARAEAVGESGGEVAVLEGISISADSKDQSVGVLRGIEVMLDGSTGGTVTEGVGIRIANNMQADKITTMTALQIYSDSFAYDYGIDMSQGTGGIDTDIKLSDGGLIGNSGGITYIKAGTSGGLGLYEDGGSGIFIKDGGWIGLGTINPSSAITIRTSLADVYNGAAEQLKQTGIEIINLSNVNNTFTQIVFKTRSSGMAYGRIAAVATNWDTCDLVFCTESATVISEKLRIISNGDINIPIGNLGIGTTTFSANAVGTLQIANGTAPTAHLDDTINIYSVDSSDTKATLGLFLEQEVEAVDGFTETHKFKILINGTEYWIALDPV